MAGLISLFQKGALAPDDRVGSFIGPLKSDELEAERVSQEVFAMKEKCHSYDGDLLFVNKKNEWKDPFSNNENKGSKKE